MTFGGFVDGRFIDGGYANSDPGDENDAEGGDNDK